MEWLWNGLQYIALPIVGFIGGWLWKLDDRIFQMNKTFATKQELESVRLESATLLKEYKEEVRTQITDLKTDISHRFDRIENLLK